MGKKATSGSRSPLGSQPAPQTHKTCSSSALRPLGVSRYSTRYLGPSPECLKYLLGGGHPSFSPYSVPNWLVAWGVASPLCSASVASSEKEEAAWLWKTHVASCEGDQDGLGAAWRWGGVPGLDGVCRQRKAIWEPEKLVPPGCRLLQGLREIPLTWCLFSSSFP